MATAMDEQAIRNLQVVDVDAHIIEPRDLYTSRVSTKKWGDLVPQIRWDDDIKKDVWWAGGRMIQAAGSNSLAGYEQHAPDWRPHHDDIPVEHIDPKARLRAMDEYGIHAAVLYPNVGVFHSSKWLTGVDPEFAWDCVRAYNDWLIEEWYPVAPDRYVATATLPFWNIDDAIAELQRSKALGHRGVIMSIRPEHFGLPMLDQRHWDPLWAAAQEAEMSINFHIGSSGMQQKIGVDENGYHANYALMAVLLDMDNMYTLSALIFGGICHRFPGLDFISVESGIGWVPSLLESMDWQWRNSGVRKDHPEYDLLPSEYFRRQIYACWWFERGIARAAIDAVGADNFLFETDYPHPTSMSPGPASIAQRPIDYVVETFGDLPEPVLRKVLHDNAAKIYGLPLLAPSN
jgi:predicted TIM-barrel fold metal-dependent hydrolase